MSDNCITESVNEVEAGMTGMAFAVREARDRGTLSTEDAQAIIHRGIALAKALLSGRVVSYTKGQGAEIEEESGTLVVGGDK